nr:kelch-like protein 33 [Paramormyrops kingsleyae]
MDINKHLPKEWEEKWKAEKEQRKKMQAEGGEGLEAENRKLQWIKAYNSHRMGVKESNIKGKTERKENEAVNPTEYEEQGEDEGEKETKTYYKQSYTVEIFQALKDFKESLVLTDLTLSTADGRRLCTHSSVMAAVSTLLHRQVQQRDKEKNAQKEQSEADLSCPDGELCVSLGPEIEFAGLASVVEFAYTGTILGLTGQRVAQVQAAAHALEASRVLEVCSEKEEQQFKVEEVQRERKIERKLKESLQCIRQLWMEKLGCDVELEAEGQSFHAHRVILAASSDYFRAMFTSGMRESHQPIITLLSLGSVELETLIDCSYSGTLPLGWDSVFQLTCTALQLQIQPALSLCLDFLHKEIDANSCLDVASFAEAYGMPALQELAEDFILRCFPEVAATPKFLDLPPEKLYDYSSSDSLCVPSELAVFRAIVAWIEANPKERLGLAKQLMTGVRFPLMTFREFREVRAINLRMECDGEKEVDLYGAALKEFGFGLSDSLQKCRVRHPKDTLLVVGGDQLDPDFGQRLPSRQLWFINSLRNRTGLVKEVEWRLLGEMPDSARFRHGLAVLGGQVYIAGGCDYYAKGDTLKSAYRYDPVQNTWQRLADMHEFRSNFSLVVRGEKLYAMGGDKEINTNLATVECYCPDKNHWSFAHPLDQASSGYAATVWEGEIFISGGFNCKYQCLVSMFLYHPERGTTYLSDMSQDRAEHCMEKLTCRLYVAGGVCNLRKFYTDQLFCESYDPMTDCWSSIPSLPIPHVGAASAVLEGKVYILGGYSQEDYSESALLHRYDPASLRWENMGRMPGPKTDIRACVLRLPPHLRS